MSNSELLREQLDNLYKKYYHPTEEEIFSHPEILSAREMIHKVDPFFYREHFNESRVLSVFIDMRNHFHGSKLLVKYLDIEDIESLGWKPTEYKGVKCFEFKHFMLTKFEDNPILSIDSVIEGKLDQIFRGTIKNKQDLNKLMKQLNIL